MTKSLDCKINFPEIDTVCQGEECFTVEQKNGCEEIRVHEYDKIYSVPGLYEHLFYERLKCNSPSIVCSLLGKQLNGNTKTALDIGAGNGMVAEELKKVGVDEVVGIDIIEEAAMAAERDRPGLYEQYYVADLTDLEDNVEKDLAQRNFNCMTIVAALGFDDIPPEAFATGYNFVEQNGLIAFNIKERFVTDDDDTGFSRLINRMIETGALNLKEKERYRHRYCMDGRPLYYYAMVGEKKADITDGLLAEIS